jgi:hypothetical protein
MSFTEETSHPEMSLLNLVALRNISRMVVTLVTFQPDILPSNDVAPENISLMSVTLFTSHTETSLLNRFAPANIPRMVVTFDTTHPPMSPSKIVAP